MYHNIYIYVLTLELTIRNVIYMIVLMHVYYNIYGGPSMHDCTLIIKLSITFHNSRQLKMLAIRNIIIIMKIHTVGKQYSLQTL